MNPLDLTGKVALVTGGSRGLGLSMARALGAAGARVVIAARKAHELEAARAALGTRGMAVDATIADLSDLDAIPGYVDALLTRHGAIDILVNNAGASWGAPSETHPLEAWRKVMTINLDGVFALTQAVAARSMLPRRSGSIVIVASIAGLGGAPAGTMAAAAYHASKAGAINLARALACEWGARGLRVNALCPGWFPTRMSGALLAEHGDAFLGNIPMARFGDPEGLDITGPLLFLASDLSRYVTGAVLTADGGLSAVA